MLFTLYDLMYFIVAFIAALFALFFLQLKEGNRVSNRLLAIFLCTQSLMAILAVVLFSKAFVAIEPVAAKYFYNLLGFAFWLEGFMLYFFTRSLLFENVQWHKTMLWHFLPVLLAGIYLYFLFYQYDATTKLGLAGHDGVVFWQMRQINLMAQIVGIVYGFFCLKNIKQYQKNLENKYSDTAKIDLFWLQFLVKSHLLIRLGWMVFPVLMILTLLLNDLPAEYFTVSGYMGHFFDIVWLLQLSGVMYFGFNYSPKFEGLKVTQKSYYSEHINESDVDRIVNFMQNQRPYLAADLNLDELSHQLSMPHKKLSAILNRHFQQNFCEFVNKYRIDEATNILSDPDHRDKNIMEVLNMVGFNSKSAFNRFFKQYTEMTPSQYRKSMLD